MTTVSSLSNQGTPATGVSWDNVDKFTFDISEMNAVINAYNVAMSTSYPKWETIEDNFEKLIHFIHVYCIVQNLILGNDTFNIKWTSTTPQNQLFGSRGTLNSRIISLAFPFSSGNDVVGDSDNIG